MVKPSVKILSAIISLENNSMFQEVIKWIDDSLTAELERLPNLRGEETIVSQGGCRELQRILGVINGAREGIESARLESQKDKSLSRRTV
jgi:hypothetical protein